MKVEHQALRATRDVAAFKLMSILAQFFQRQMQQERRGVIETPEMFSQEEHALAQYQRHQKAWMDVFGSAPTLFVSEALGVPIEHFPFAWRNIESHTGLGRHIDAAHAKWSRFGHSVIGDQETEIQTRIYSMVHAGANDWLLARMLGDIGEMPGVLARNEFGSALTLALALDSRRKGTEAKYGEITRQLLPIYDRATVTMKLTKMEAEKALTKARRMDP